MPKTLTVWITINWGKFWKRWEYQSTWPAPWETCVQVRKQQLNWTWNNRLVPNRKRSKLCMKCSLGISNFLEEIPSLSHFIVFLYFLHWSLRKAFLSLLAILWNSAFRCLYLSFSTLFFASLLFTAICKASSYNHFAFSYFFFLGMVLIPGSFTMSQTQSIVH